MQRFVITFYHSALGVFSLKKGVLKSIRFPIALMPSVQRGPIDFSGDGLVSIRPSIVSVNQICNNDVSMYDGGYLITFYTPMGHRRTFFLSSLNFFFTFFFHADFFFHFFFHFFFSFLTPPDPPKSAPKWGVRKTRKKKVKKGRILTRRPPPFLEVGRPNVHHSPLSPP